MSKKVLINEQQLAILVNYIKENENPLVIKEEELLEEGFKEWALAGLMALASIGGVKAQDVDKLTLKHIEAAQVVQNKLNSGDLDGDGAKDLKQYFTQADIDLNKINLDKLMNADIDSELKTYKTKSITSVRAKEKSDWVLSGLKVNKDTLWKSIPAPASIVNTVSSKFNGNVFGSSDFTLNKEVVEELDYLISKIETLNGKITSVKIKSSTDKEPIEKGGGLWNAGIRDNSQLAQKRAEGVKDYLNSKGVEVSDGDIITTPEQGPDIYSDDMQDRESSREKTKEFRNVVVDIEFEVVPAGEEEKEVSKIIDRIEYEMLLKKPTYSNDYKISRKSGGRQNKKQSCKVKKRKGKSIPCAKFN